MVEANTSVWIKKRPLSPVPHLCSSVSLHLCFISSLVVVCISVQSFVLSLLCHLLCSIDPAFSLMFLHVWLLLYCHVKSGGAGSSLNCFTPGRPLPDLCHKILSGSFWTCIEVGIYSTDVTELHCSKVTLFALVTAQPNSTRGGWSAVQSDSSLCW